MGWETELADVVAGQPIASAWGNQIRDRVVHLIATPAALPTDEPDGGLAYVASDDRLYERWNGQWVWIAGAGRVGLHAGSNSSGGYHRRRNRPDRTHCHIHRGPGPRLQTDSLC